jgi:hypothetical protein
MSTGRTAIDAIVSDAPTSDSPPNVSAAAATAIASGSSRSRLRKTSASVAAMTSSAANSRAIIDPVIEDVRSETTTGAPVTVYVAPLRGFQAGIATAARMSRIASVRAASPRPARRRTWTSAVRPGPLPCTGKR